MGAGCVVWGVGLKVLSLPARDVSQQQRPPQLCRASRPTFHAPGSVSRLEIVSGTVSDSDATVIIVIVVYQVSKNMPPVDRGLSLMIFEPPGDLSGSWLKVRRSGYISVMIPVKVIASKPFPQCSEINLSRVRTPGTISNNNAFRCFW